MQTVAELNYNTHVEIMMGKLCEEREMPIIQRVSWSVDGDPLADLPVDPLARLDRMHEKSALIEIEDALICLGYYADRGELSVEVAAKSEARCLAVVEDMKKRYPVASPPPDDEVRINFWMDTAHGPKRIVRRVVVPEWSDISGNYSGEVRFGIDPIISDHYRPDSGGQLILWHGPPGTGKTYAIRALARAWKPWADVDYVADPEEFFGQASYLLSVLLRDHDDGPDEEKNERWRLIILEDAGELMSADARERSGQGLSRLLNLTDGLIGQGLKTVVMLTTNEDIRTLHPAVSRPGRCAASVRFGELTEHESREWIAAHNLDARITGAKSLAELYAVKEQDRRLKVVPTERRMGFGA